MKTLKLRDLRTSLLMLPTKTFLDRLNLSASTSCSVSPYVEFSYEMRVYPNSPMAPGLMEHGSPMVLLQDLALSGGALMDVLKCDSGNLLNISYSASFPYIKISLICSCNSLCLLLKHYKAQAHGGITLSICMSVHLSHFLGSHTIH